MALELKNYEPALAAGANVGVSVDLTDITDQNGNEVIEVDGVTSAVNYTRIANAATGTDIELSAQGDDTNVGMKLTPKGTGGLTLTVGTATALTITGTLGSPTGGINLAVIGSTNTVLFVPATTTTFTQPLQIGTAVAQGAIKIDVAGTARYIFFYK